MNSTIGQIKKLQGRSNVLERSIDETRSTISNVEKGLKSEIKQTAESITSIVSSTQIKWDVSKYEENGWKIIYGTSAPSGISPSGEKELYVKVDTGDSWDPVYDAENQKYIFKYNGPLKKTTETIQSSIEETEKSITASVNSKFENYSTTEETNSAIEISKEGIESTVAKSQDTWETVDANGNEVNISEYGYGIDGHMETGEPYVYSETIQYGEFYLDQETGKAWKCNGFHWFSGRQVAILLNEPTYTFKKISENLSSEISQQAQEIVLKVDANGRIVEVSLTGDPKDGTVFTVDADNISLTASDIIDIIANNSINLTSKHISIDSTNFSVDEDGNMKCNEGEFSGTVKGGSVIGSTIYGNRDLYLCETIFNPSVVPNYRRALSSGSVTSGVTGKVLFVGDGFEGVYLPQTVFLGYNNVFPVGSKTVDLESRRITEIHLYAPLGNTNFNFTADNGVTYAIAASASDTKLKKNIKKTEQTSLDKIRRIQFIQFDWKENGSHVPLGVSANQLGEIIPQAVLDVPQPDDSEYNTLKNVDMFTTINYSLKAIQEMDEIIQEQKQEIDTLKQQLATLTERMDRYEQGL